ncbi:hypothetical protein [Lignipirellula cremea]|uniref:ISKra4 family transposase n=1 Tax=Lignipirellula cremea TaxID=2528010 RepID=A0A518DRM8_9BACT|nr:hypothetical protein [Lignipirellula cremea]QDU94498.1 hypothetical protein Pla8534_22890 [Lignipirellula cremea]
MLTLNGRVVLRRTRWHCPLDGAETPIDRWLDAAEATITRGFCELSCRLNQGSVSFEQTADNLWRAARLKISKETLRQIIEAEGKQVQQAMQQGAIVPDWSAEDCREESGAAIVYCGCDGVKVPLVTEEEKKKRRNKVRQKRQKRGRRCRPLPRRKPGADNAYKEFRVGVYYQQGMQRKYVGVTSGDCQAAGRMLRRMGDQLVIAQADECIGLIDGAPWIRNQMELHGLTTRIGLDFYHLQDYAQRTRLAVFGEDSATGKQWVGELMSDYKHRGYQAASDQLWDWRAPQFLVHVL